MRLFKRRQPFDIAEVPPIDLRRGATVDIGHLGGEKHRQAFAAIFAKMLSDNATLLLDYEIVRVEAKRPIRAALVLPMPVRELAAAPAQLALALYDSGNERVWLDLARRGAVLRMGLRFDDPEFWLE